jgi:hypothetical protein
MKRMRDEDVNRLIENLEKALRKDPVKHCEVYRGIGCTHVDGYLCDMRTCDIRQKFLNGTLDFIPDIDPPI